MINAEKKAKHKYFEKRERKRQERNFAKILRQQMIAFVVAKHFARNREGAVKWLKHHGFFQLSKKELNSQS